MKKISPQNDDDPYEVLGEKGLAVELTPWNQYAIGISYEELKDDETGKEFKERATALLKEVFPDLKLLKKDIGFLLEGFSDNF